MGAMASQITSLAIVYSIVHSGADQRRHQRSASLAFVWGIHRLPVNSPHKWPVMRKMFPFDDVIMSFKHPNWLECSVSWLARLVPITLVINSTGPTKGGLFTEKKLSPVERRNPFTTQQKWCAGLRHFQFLNNLAIDLRHRTLLSITESHI